MKVLICGSRYWTDRQKIQIPMMRMLTEDDHLIHGDQGYYDKRRGLYVGVDKIAASVAIMMGMLVTPYPAQWSKQGRAAGPLRNQRMLEDELPDEVWAFRLSGKSNGTDDMIARAVDGGVPVLAFYLENEVLTETYIGDRAALDRWSSRVVHS